MVGSVDDVDDCGGVGEVASPIWSTYSKNISWKHSRRICWGEGGGTYRMLDCPPRSHTWNFMFLYYKSSCITCSFLHVVERNTWTVSTLKPIANQTLRSQYFARGGLEIKRTRNGRYNFSYLFNMNSSNVSTRKMPTHLQSIENGSLPSRIQTEHEDAHVLFFTPSYK